MWQDTIVKARLVCWSSKRFRRRVSFTVIELFSTSRESVSDQLLSAEEGSLYPALDRMEQSGWIGSEWALTETNRRAKYWRLTAVEKMELDDAEKSFEQVVKGARAMLSYA